MLGVWVCSCLSRPPEPLPAGGQSRGAVAGPEGLPRAPALAAARHCQRLRGNTPVAASLVGLLSAAALPRAFLFFLLPFFLITQIFAVGSDQICWSVGKMAFTGGSGEG